VIDPSPAVNVLRALTLLCGPLYLGHFWKASDASTTRTVSASIAIGVIGNVLRTGAGGTVAATLGTGWTTGRTFGRGRGFARTGGGACGSPKPFSVACP
jgi:hypothetical protein